MSKEEDAHAAIWLLEGIVDGHNVAIVTSQHNWSDFIIRDVLAMAHDADLEPKAWSRAQTRRASFLNRTSLYCFTPRTMTHGLRGLRLERTLVLETGWGIGLRNDVRDELLFNAACENQRWL